MKRSIAFSKNLNSLDDSLPAIGPHRKLNSDQCHFNMIETDDSDADFIAQIQQPKKFHCHKSFVDYYSVDKEIAGIGSANSSSSSQYPLRKVSLGTVTPLPDLPPCDFLTTGCARFDSILTLKENEHKKRCIVTAHLSEEILFEKCISMQFTAPRLPQLSINLTKVNYIDEEVVVAEPGCSPNSVAAISDETSDEFGIKQIGLGLLTARAVRPAHPPTVLLKPATSTASLRNGRTIIHARRSSLVD
jgi:hypothetical protein